MPNIGLVNFKYHQLNDYNSIKYHYCIKKCLNITSLNEVSTEGSFQFFILKLIIAYQKLFRIDAEMLCLFYNFHKNYI